MNAGETMHRISGVHLKLHDVILIAVAAGSVIAFFLSKEGKTSSQSEQITSLRETVTMQNDNIKRTNDRIGDLDSKGTQASQSQAKLFEEKNLELNRRITNMETTLSAVVPDVREIKTKLQIVADWLEKKEGRK